MKRGKPEKRKPAAPGAVRRAECPVCGLSRADLASSGKAGCQHCYEFFRKEISALLQSACGRDSYPDAGLIPARAGRTPLPIRSKDIELQLQQALRKEDFERAVILRDLLRQRSRR